MKPPPLQVSDAEHIQQRNDYIVDEVRATELPVPLMSVLGGAKTPFIELALESGRDPPRIPTFEVLSDGGVVLSFR